MSEMTVKNGCLKFDNKKRAPPFRQRPQLITQA